MLTVSWCWGFVYPTRGGALGRAAPRWVMHFFLWTAVFASLWYLNQWGGFERFLRSPWPMLHRFWLPMFAAGVYGLGWLARGLWLSLGRDPLPGPCWEVDAAWSETRSDLAMANIDLRRTPVFLILGSLTSDLQTLLVSLGASAISQNDHGPFHAFACREGVFLVCGQNPRGPAAERLRQLCQVLTYERSPRLPIQGIMLIVPFGTRVIKEFQDDLRIVREGTGIEVPVYVGVRGAEVKGGGDWFQPFPPMPDLNAAEVLTMVQEGIDWLCLDRMAADVRTQFRLDRTSPEPGKVSQALHENIRLYQSLRAIQAWRGRLIELLVKGTQNGCSEVGMVAGCYFLPSSGKSRTLAAALWGDLLLNQHTAAWTASARAKHAERRRLAWLGYGLGVVGVGVVAAAGLGAFLLRRW